MNSSTPPPTITVSRGGTTASLIYAIVMYGASRGADLPKLSRAAGVDPAHLADPDARLPDQAIADVWKAMGEAFPGEPLGLQLVSVTPMSIFGPFIMATRHADTLREVLQAFARYGGIMSGGLTLSLEEDRREAAFIMDHKMDAFDQGYGGEWGLGITHRMSAEVFGGEDMVIRVEMRHDPHGPVEGYQKHFGVPVTFGHQKNRLIYKPRSLDAAASQPVPELYGHVAQMLHRSRALIAERINQHPLAEIRSAIAHNAQHGLFSAGDLADNMGMGMRTLQRLAKGQGTSVTELIEQEREAQARQLLAANRLTVEQIAFLLDYSDDATFRRAFHRWTGQSPAAFRKTARGGHTGA